MAGGRIRKALIGAENAFAPLLLMLITLILAFTIVARLFGVSELRASTDYVRHLVLWISFAGAMITTREKSHLSLSIGVDTFGTGTVDEARIVDLVRKHFPLEPASIIAALDLLRPIYRKTAAYGHFGREDPEFTWERTDRADALRKDAG